MFTTPSLCGTLSRQNQFSLSQHELLLWVHGVTGDPFLQRCPHTAGEEEEEEEEGRAVTLDGTNQWWSLTLT